MTIPGASGQHVGRHNISLNPCSKKPLEFQICRQGGRLRVARPLRLEDSKLVLELEPTIRKECGSITTKLSGRAHLNPSHVQGNVKVPRAECSIVAGLETLRAR